MWAALKAACETDDMAMVTAIVESAGINLPRGTLDLAYDELGNEYVIPPYCFSFPTNMVDDTTSIGEPNPKGLFFLSFPFLSFPFLSFPFFPSL